VSALLKLMYLRLDHAALRDEHTQCRDEGRDLASVEDEFAALAELDLDKPANQARAAALLDRTIELPIRVDYPHNEPSDLAGIVTARPPGHDRRADRPGRDALLDRLHGAWLGRCAGCLLGKPVEGRHREVIWSYLRDSGQWPLTGYMRRDEAAAAKHDIKTAAFIDDVACMPEDDDTNYTLIGLEVLSKHGRDFEPRHVAERWMAELPLLHTFTAERVALRNFANLVAPPASASVRNPYREWIGAQIRADFFGYAAPGDPQQAARWAWRDACISHVKNGIYGEMWVAAMLAWALVCDDIDEVIAAGLEQIPADCRLAQAVRRTVGQYHDGLSYDAAVEQLHAEWDEKSPYGWCHTISNAIIVTLGLLHGRGDFGQAICRAVQPAFDTDCNGATVGSIFGAMHGAAAIGEEWTAPLNDRLESGLSGRRVSRISDLARETLDLAASLG
jgi:ADP-ribosylglycohydrolase